MPNLKPFRQYNPHDVINMLSYSGDVSSTVNKGTLVKIVGSGVDFSQDPMEFLGAPGASYSNTVSQRYGVPWQVAPCQTGAAGVQDQPLGLTLWDVRETDENGEKLLYNRRKREELQCVKSGEAVPVVTRGLFYYTGTLCDSGPGSVGANTAVYAGANGELSTAADGKLVGRTVGPVDAFAHVLLKLEL